MTNHCLTALVGPSCDNDIVKAILLAVMLATGAPACTLVIGGTSGLISSSHNGDRANANDQWPTAEVMVVGSLIGLAIDVSILYLLSKAFPAPR
jgi:ABC-type spermidine/putrescine transport system permease subunit I